MGLTATDTTKKYPPTPEGIHKAVCYAVYDLGTHYDDKWNKYNRKIRIMWELPEERIDMDKDGESISMPRGISREYTLSLHKKSNLRADLESWRGKSFTKEELDGFDLKKLIGVNCMIQVFHNDTGEYANVKTVVPLMKGMESTEPENPVRFFSFEDQTEVPEGTVEWVAKIIKESDEYRDAHETQVHSSEAEPPEDGSMLDDKIPF